MTSLARSTRSAIIPTVRYRDAPAAIEWLCKAFGFERHRIVPGENGTIAHAQLTFGNGMIILGTLGSGEFDQLTKAPSLVGGTTQSPYIVVADIDGHYERVKAAGAKIAIEIKDEDYGGHDYSCTDPEGHLWNFGSYDPWAEPVS